MEKAHYRRLTVVACAVFCVVALLPAPAAAQADHLWWAEQLVNNVLPENNVYGGSPSYITWVDVDGATEYTNRTQCSSFLTRLLERAYGWTDDDIALWLGSTSPLGSHLEGARGARSSAWLKSPPETPLENANVSDCRRSSRSGRAIGSGSRRLGKRSAGRSGGALGTGEWTLTWVGTGVLGCILAWSSCARRKFP